MNLFRIHAYEVTPQRLSTSAVVPRGGACPVDDSFKTSLDLFLRKSRLAAQPAVDFRIPPTPTADLPAQNVRNFILDYTFAHAPTAKAAAEALAKRLGRSMDNRSPFTLMILAAYEDGKTRRFVLWAFPKDEPLQFSVSGARARLKILKDAFSRSSTFKKAALFEGTNSSTTFLSGRVIDKQAQNGLATAADYWVSKFLDCRFSLTENAGTRLLAKCLRATHDSLSSQDDRDQISNAIVALNTSKRPRWSIQTFSNEFLEGSAKRAFLAQTPPESRTTTFELQKEEFAKKLNFRVFRLGDNVMVSAPFGAIGKSVKIKEGVQRTLKCQGTIVDEKVRAMRV